MAIYLIIFIFLTAIIVFFVFIQGNARLSRIEKEEFLNYYSSVLSDLNMDYRDMGISPENITHIAGSISNFSERVNSLAPEIKKSSKEIQVWFIDIIDEFYKEVALWTERHADEIVLYEKSLPEGDPTIQLLKTRLLSQSENLKKVTVL
ncbi:MAG: hypothetical protein HHAS10_06400 [Candidatus Altimarinota bacterium]